MTPVRQAHPTDVVVVELPEGPDPLEGLDRLEGLPGRALLHSAQGGRYSLLLADPVRTLAPRGGGDDPAFDPLETLGDTLEALAAPPPPEGIPFAGGVVGFLGYEAGDQLEHLPPAPPDDLGVPTCWFGVYDRVVVWDHSSGRCRAAASVMPGSSVSNARERLSELTVRVLKTGTGPLAPGSPEPDASRPRIATSLGREPFEEGVRRIQEYIRKGDLFQANLTRRISATTPLDGASLFRRLLRESAARYSAYIDTGFAEVASISPELFLSVRDGKVTTRPIKGTAARGGTEEEDARLRRALEASEKDRAENVMIVDLLRNDLSRVCRPGSVRVPRLAALETHPTVHHLVSTVTGTLSASAGVPALLRATFPGGSITGAPKIRAMEILRELEPVRRGVYTGALGIFGFHGDLELSIAIRTAVLTDGVAHYGTGGGITLASDPEDEWFETEHKARAFLRAVGAPAPSTGPDELHSGPPNQAGRAP